MKDKKTKSKLSMFFLVLSIIFFISSGALFGKQVLESYLSKAQADASAENAINIIDNYTKGNKAKSIDKDEMGKKIVAGLQKAYNHKSVTGMLEGGPLISAYPIIGTKSYEDEDYWLRHELDGKWTWDGTLFTDCNADPNFGSWNTTIFGHRMKSLHMFGTFRYFENQAEYDDLKKNGKDIFTLTSYYGKRKYKVASVIMTQLYDRSFFISDKNEDWLKDKLGQSVVNTGINQDEVLKAKSFLTLVTCTNASGPNRTILICYQI